MGLIYSLIC